jgi:DNA polymerase-3 subunit gamma/tau
MGLYQKHRPQTFAEIRGNRQTVQTLEGMLSKPENCPHSFLLTGGTGTGKTTLGRIITKRLEADDFEIIEIDTADFRGIDMIRNIREKSQYIPMRGKCKVWILDEVHKLSNDAQNAILKMLEDPPSHVYFILCTTDPEKLIRTIRGRCQQFQMELLKDEDMMKVLLDILKKEEQSVGKKVLNQIIESAQGHSRNAIQILEQVLQVDTEEQLQVAKRVEQQQNEMIELARALYNNKPWKAVNTILRGLKGQEAESIRRVILGYAQAVLLNKEDQRAADIIEEFFEPLFNIGFPGLVFNCYNLCK